MKTETTGDKITSMIENSIVSVLSRPRFNIRVGSPVFSRSGPMISRRILEKDDYQYNIQFARTKNQTSVMVKRVEVEGVDWNNVVFYCISIKHHELPNIRKIGVTIANKIKMRVVHDVMSD
jgi:hypothetical protein